MSVALVFQDVFQRANAANLGGNWSGGSGFSIAGNYGLGSAVSVAQFKGSVPADCRVVAQEGVLGTGAWGVVARATNATNYYEAQIANATQVYIRKIVAGVATNLGGPYAITRAAGSLLMLDCIGTSLQAWYGSTLLGTVTDSTYVNGGLASTGLSYDWGTAAAITSLVASLSGGSLATGTVYVKVTAINSAGAESTASAESSVAVTGPNASVAVTITAYSGASSYRVYISSTAGGEVSYFASAGTSFTITTLSGGTTATPPPGVQISRFDARGDEVWTQVPNSLVVAPAYSTDVAQYVSGLKQRNQLWLADKVTLKIGYEALADSDKKSIQDFFRRKRGMWQPFVIQDPTWVNASAPQLSQEVFAVADGVSTVYKANVDKAAAISTYTDGTLDGSQPAVSLLTGLIIYATAPYAGAVLSHDVTTPYYRVYFAKDEMPFTRKIPTFWTDQVELEQDKDPNLGFVF